MGCDDRYPGEGREIYERLVREQSLPLTIAEIDPTSPAAAIQREFGGRIKERPDTKFNRLKKELEEQETREYE